jgi:2-phosphoglycerate kinase
MAKIFVTDRAGGNPVPFLRGILTRSLSEAGLSFEQAYGVASDVRERLGDASTVTNEALRALVHEQLRARFAPGVAEAYDAARAPVAGLLVRRADGEPQPFSRMEHVRCLAACGLSEAQAGRASDMILEGLSKKQHREITSRRLRELTQNCLEVHFGERAGERYRVWMEFSHSGRPLILLIGGTTGSGKSTVATELAHRLGIVRTQSTDLLREVMRMLIPERLLPVLHRSSFDAWRAFGSRGEGNDDPDELLAAGYLRQSELLAVPCEAVIGRAVRERVSLILEGVHVHPDMQARIGAASDAVVVTIMLGVLKPEDLRARLSGRRIAAPERGGEAQLDNFDYVWRLQAYLLSEADRVGTPILVNDDKDKVTDLVLRAVIDVLAGAGMAEGARGG